MADPFLDMLKAAGGVEAPEADPEYQALVASDPEPEPTIDDLFGKAGGVAVGDANTTQKDVKEPEELDRTLADDGRPQYLHAGEKALAAIEAEVEGVRAMADDDPRKATKSEDIKRRYRDKAKQHRILELRTALDIDPEAANTGLALNMVDEGLQAAHDGLLGGIARGIGNDTAANHLAAAKLMRSELYSLENQDGFLGPTLGPLVGSIGASLVETTAGAVTTGGIVGVAGMLGIDAFNSGMHEARDLSPMKQLQHATGKAVVTTGVTLAGGAAAKRLNVASGESIVPLVGRTTSKLFTKAGGAKVATASGIEGVEEAIDAGGQGINAVMSGQDPEALKGIGWEMAKNFAIGSTVGTLAQGMEHHAELGPAASHVRDTVEGWTKRLRKETDPPRPKQADDVGTVETEVGNLKDRKSINDELEALGHLEQEIEERYMTQQAPELAQRIVERKAALAEYDTDIAAMHADRSAAEADAKEISEGAKTLLEDVYAPVEEKTEQPGVEALKSLGRKGFDPLVPTQSRFETSFHEAFDAAAKAGDGYVSLEEMRKAFPEHSREEFEAELYELRKSGLYGLLGTGNRTDITPAQLEAGIPDSTSPKDVPTKFTHIRKKRKAITKAFEERGKQASSKEKKAAKVEKPKKKTLNKELFPSEASIQRRNRAVPQLKRVEAEIKKAEKKLGDQDEFETERESDLYERLILMRERLIDRIYPSLVFDWSKAYEPRPEGMTKYDYWPPKLREGVVEPPSITKTTDMVMEAWAKENNLATDDARLDAKIAMLEDERDLLATRIEDDTLELQDWESEQDARYEAEKATVAEDIARLNKLKEQPDIAEKLDEVETEPEQKQDKEDPEGTKDTEPKEKLPEPEPVETADRVYTEFEKRLGGVTQEDLRAHREYLGLDELEQRKVLPEEEAFRLARERGLDKQAMGLVQEVLNNPERVLTTIEKAGLQLKYASELRAVLDERAEIKANKGTMSQEVFDSMVARMEAREAEIDKLTHAWIQTASGAGSALNAQKRFLYEKHSAEWSRLKAQRNKGSELTADEKANIDKTAQDVKDKKEAFDNMVKEGKHEKGSKEYDLADMELFDARMQNNAAVRKMKKQFFGRKAIEAYNAYRMAMSLAGDLIPLGRQGFTQVMSHPIRTWQNKGAFFNPLISWNHQNAELKAFRVERKIREDPLYRVLTQDYNIPIKDDSSAYSQIEGSGAQRMYDSLTDNKATRGLVKTWKGSRLGLFDVAYKSWLNQLRFDVAKAAYLANKDLLNQPNGKADMQRLIDHGMAATGHTTYSLGAPGQIGMTAPRWFLSRGHYVATSAKHIPYGLWSMAMGKKNVSTHIAKEYGRVIGGTQAFWAAAQIAAASIFGEENVSFSRNPFDKDFGKLMINDRSYDLTGGMGFVFRALSATGKGVIEAASGPDYERDTDAAKVVGGLITSRFSPAFRDVGQGMQSGKPVNENEVQGLAEWFARNHTFLSWQEVVDAMTDEGVPEAAAAALLENFGFSGYDRKN